jgi:hypothetical protein
VSIDSGKKVVNTDGSKLKLKSERKGVFKIKEATFIWEIYSGDNKDYYFNIEIEALRQKFKLFRKRLIGDKYE